MRGRALVGPPAAHYVRRVTAPAARSRPRPRWVAAPAPDAAAVAALVAELRLPPAVCGLLVARGHAVPDGAKRFLRPRLDQLHAPSQLRGLDAAVERLARAVRAGETVLVHGDYDVDGICSTTLLTRAIRQLGGTAVPFIPRRLEDGYDLTAAGVAAARAAGAAVVVTCDCGTSAVAPVAALCAAGVDVIVTDHHLPGNPDAPLPHCLALLNPNAGGCSYPDKGLCGAGIAFKLALALSQALGAGDGPILRMLDLVALATIADIAPLRGENRVFARYGLKLLAETANPGLRALIRAAGLEGKALTAGRVGYILAPRLNAVGRLDRAIRGVELLLTDSEGDANRLARDLEELNRRRQELDRATLDEARRMVDALDLDDTYGIVLGAHGWHAGVIGIVASRIVEETGRPAVLVAVDGAEGKGSGRSIPAFDLHAALGECRDLFTRFGGHKAAAGVTIDAANLPRFAERFNEVARARLTEADLVPEMRVDLELPLASVNADLEALFRHFEPFGVGNAAPLLVARGVRLAAPPRTVGADGLKLRLAAGDGELEAIGWGMAARLPELALGAPFDVAFRLERDEYRGESRLQAKLADIRT